MRRREFLTAGAAAVGALSLTGTSSAETDWAAKPSHVTLEFDEAALKRYQPLFITSQAARERYNGCFGYKATSDEYDYDVYCYWSQLTHQDGLLLVNKDTHLGDHEPAYVFVADGSVERVVYTGYHHFASEVQSPEANLTEARADEPTHINLRVVDPWHHYYHPDDGEGAFQTLKNWVEVRDSWRDNGFYEKTSARAIEDPFVMLHRDTWWADGTWDAEFARLWQWLGLGGARDNTR